MSDLLAGQKAAAARLGISEVTYAGHLEAGESWCWDCKRWRIVSHFYRRWGHDSSPSGQCIDCHRVYMKNYMRKRYAAKKVAS